MHEADAQHQDEMLKQERLFNILKDAYLYEDILDSDILYLASALGLSNELNKFIQHRIDKGTEPASKW